MGKQEDNLLSEMLNSMENLPENYNPNLNAKWELLNNALSPDQGKRTGFFWLKWSVAALVLLSIGGFIYRNQSGTPSVESPEIVLVPHISSKPIVNDNKQENSIAFSQENNKPRFNNKKVISSAPAQEAILSNVVITKDTVVEISTGINSPDTSDLLSIKVNQQVKKKRYVTVDFGTDASVEATANTAFKVNFLKRNQPEEASSVKSGSTLLFKKSF